MNLLKYAFEEGRDTKISWENSESLKKAHLLELQMNNILNNRNYKGQKRKVAQIHPSTGRTVNVFDSAFAAARWINNNKPGRKTTTRAYQCFGNMKMMMVNGRQAYGYYWMLLEPDTKIETTYNFPKHGGGYSGKAKNCVIVNDETGQVTKINSIEDVAEFVGANKATLYRRLKELDSYSVNGYTIYRKQKYQTSNVPKKLIMRNTSGHFQDVFMSYSDAADFVGATVMDIINSVKYGREVSGYKFFRA